MRVKRQLQKQVKNMRLPLIHFVIMKKLDYFQMFIVKLMGLETITKKIVDGLSLLNA